MNRSIVILSSILFTGGALAVQPAATIAFKSGTVLVNQGKQFVTAQSGQLLTAGDRIMIMEGGKASIRYADGCMQELASGSLIAISKTSTCDFALNKTTKIAPLTAQAVGDDNDNDCDDDGILDQDDNDIDGDDILNPDDKYQNCKGGFVWPMWAVGGAALVGAAVVIGNGDDDTISP
jgi:hypothetical protein